METLFFNRELSWLKFNYRVLQEAMDKKNPLMERVRFMGIFSNNRDEFFKVRVSTYKRFIELRKKQTGMASEFDLDIDPESILHEIDKIVSQQESLFDQCFEELVTEMSKHNIFLIKETQLSDFQGKYVRGFFREKVRSYIFPLMMSNSKDLVGKLHDGEINLVITLDSSSIPSNSDVAIITVPSHRVGRFVILPSEDSKRTCIMFLDDVIRYCLKDVFGVFGYDIFQAYTIKFTRDAEFDIDIDMSKSYAQVLEQYIKQRKKGNPVRFIYDQTTPEKVLKRIMKRMKIKEGDTMYAAGRYHNFKDFMDFPTIQGSNFYFNSIPVLEHPAFSKNESVFDDMKKRDILLHYPYHSFNHIVDLLREAAMDHHVVSVDMTIYRGATNSSIVNALINASRNGKKVRVYLEFLARFDEEANLNWATQMQEEGIKIIPAVQGYKVHSKLLSIKRTEDNIIKYYTNISTGNFNESTARIYADESLLTADTIIGEEVASIFDLLEYRFRIPTLQKLIISPFNTRNFMIQQIEKEINFSKDGKESHIILKINSLSDKRIIEKLYQASQSGVKITLIVRGICMLRSGVAGLSDNIEVISIVGRFLEHSRIFYFFNNGNPQYYISSADMMVRNLDNRLECTVPITDSKLCNELWTLLQLQINDNTKARKMDTNGDYQYVESKKSKKINAQEDFPCYIKSLHELTAIS